MSKIARVTQTVFASTPGFEQVGQFGSSASPVYTSNIATIQALSAWAIGFYAEVTGPNAPFIQDMNALFLVVTQQIAYILQQGLAEWDAGTTYYAGSVVGVPLTVFTVTSANATVGATYTNNGQTFTVQSTIAGQTQLTAQFTDLPTASGTLTKASGTGDATITFSAYTVTNASYVSLAGTNIGNVVTNATYWQALLPSIGQAYQKLSVNSGGTGLLYSYDQVNPQTAPASDTVPVGYNLTTGYLTVPSGVTYTVAGSMLVGGVLQATGTGIVQATGTGIVKGF